MSPRRPRLTWRRALFGAGVLVVVIVAAAGGVLPPPRRGGGFNPHPEVRPHPPPPPRGGRLLNPDRGFPPGPPPPPPRPGGRAKAPGEAGPAGGFRVAFFRLPKGPRARAGGARLDAPAAAAQVEAAPGEAARVQP